MLVVACNADNSTFLLRVSDSCANRIAALKEMKGVMHENVIANIAMLPVFNTNRRLASRGVAQLTISCGGKSNRERDYLTTGLRKEMVSTVTPVWAVS
jgi:hypothetical protein